MLRSTVTNKDIVSQRASHVHFNHCVKNIWKDLFFHVIYCFIFFWSFETWKTLHFNSCMSVIFNVSTKSGTILLIILRTYAYAKVTLRILISTYSIVLSLLAIERNYFPLLKMLYMTKKLKLKLCGSSPVWWSII